MFTISLIAWTIIMIMSINRFPSIFKKLFAYRITFHDDSDSESDDDDYVGHASFSDNDDELDRNSESEYNPYEDEPEYMKDLYEESTFPARWHNLTEEEKKDVLDEELDKYMAKKTKEE